MSLSSRSRRISTSNVTSDSADSQWSQAFVCEGVWVSTRGKEKGDERRRRMESSQMQSGPAGCHRRKIRDGDQQGPPNVKA